MVRVYSGHPEMLGGESHHTTKRHTHELRQPGVGRIQQTGSWGADPVTGVLTKGGGSDRRGMGISPDQLARTESGLAEESASRRQVDSSCAWKREVGVSEFTKKRR